MDKWKRIDRGYPMPPAALSVISHTAELDGPYASRQIDDLLRRESLNNNQLLLDRHLKFQTWKKRGGE